MEAGVKWVVMATALVLRRGRWAYRLGQATGVRGCDRPRPVLLPSPGDRQPLPCVAGDQRAKAL